MRLCKRCTVGRSFASRPRPRRPIYPRTRKISTSPHPWSAAVDEIAYDVKTLLDANDREAALRKAVEASGSLLRHASDPLRMDLRTHVFRQFTTRGDSYQANDFECVDYGQYDLAPELPLLRGPRVAARALEQGDYFCTFGAAQTFGRLVRDPWASLLSQAIDLPVLNISRGGVGPEFFLNPRLVEYAQNARFVVLQMMSGRSVGCEEYPGGRRIIRDGKTTNVHRLDILEELWNNDRSVALSYVEKWNANYLGLYTQLRKLIGRPILLLWISDRTPGAWNPIKLMKKLTWGSFPQLVGKDLYKNVAALFEESYELVTEASPERPLNRITGEPCPYFGQGQTLHETFKYYPSSAAHAKLADAITPWARAARASRNIVAG
jgi:hypothetical protein